VKDSMDVEETEPLYDGAPRLTDDALRQWAVALTEQRNYATLGIIDELLALRRLARDVAARPHVKWDELQHLYYCADCEISSDIDEVLESPSIHDAECTYRRAVEWQEAER